MKDIKKMDTSLRNEGTHYGESGPMEFSNISEIETEINYINKILNLVQEECLLTEVVYQSLLEMKADPTLSPSEALQFGYSEWIK